MLLQKHFFKFPLHINWKSGPVHSLWCCLFLDKKTKKIYKKNPDTESMFNLGSFKGFFI